MTRDYRLVIPRAAVIDRDGDLNRRPRPPRELPVDKTLLAVVLALVVFGLMMVYSSSAILAQMSRGSQFYDLGRQAVCALLGLVAMAVAIRLDYRFYKQPWIVAALVCTAIGLLVVVLFLPERNYTHRWIRYNQFSLQPSEISKIAMIMFLGFLLERQADRLQRFTSTFVPAAVLAGIVMALVAVEPDLGTALLLGLIFLIVMFSAGVPLKHLMVLGGAGVPAVAGMLVFVPWRLQRLLDFLDPWQNATTTGFQVAQSLIAIGSGGLTGTGFSQGKQKLFYLPAPNTDFIFAVIGEELGLIGAGLTVLAFGLLAWRGMKAAKSAPDLFGRSLAVGITTMIAAQAFFNVSVALSLVPTKGIPLPFVSSGGSSLAINLFAAGVLLNISKHASESWR